MAINNLVPTRFLLLLSHLVLTIVIFHTKDFNIESCLPQNYTNEEFLAKSTPLTIALSFTIVFMVFELCGFLFGVTMFASVQNLISIAAHFSASLVLSYFILDDWPCTFYWYIFGFCSILPAVTECLAIIGFCLNWNL